jgi:hypothetical protein
MSFWSPCVLNSGFLSHRIPLKLLIEFVSRGQPCVSTADFGSATPAYFAPGHAHVRPLTLNAHQRRLSDQLKRSTDIPPRGSAARAPMSQNSGPHKTPWEAGSLLSGRILKHLFRRRIAGEGLPSPHLNDRTDFSNGIFEDMRPLIAWLLTDERSIKLKPARQFACRIPG